MLLPTISEPSNQALFLATTVTKLLQRQSKFHNSRYGIYIIEGIRGSRGGQDENAEIGLIQTALKLS